MWTDRQTQTNGLTDRHDEANAFRNFANAPNNGLIDK